MNLRALQRFFSQDWHILPSAIEPLILAIVSEEEEHSSHSSHHSHPETQAMANRPKYDRNGDPLPQMEMTDAGTAIVPIHGPIVSGATGSDKYNYGVTSPEDIAADLDEAVNQGATTILLDVNSPGGTVLGGAELAAKIDDLAGAFDLFSFNHGVSASLAEFLTVSATARFGLPSSINGSIGTILQSFDLTGLLDKFGVKVNTFASGKYKGMGSPFRSLTDAQREYLQSFVNKNAGQFKDRMQMYRPDIEAASMEGQFFDGSEAQSLGFLDELVNSRAQALAAIS